MANRGFLKPVPGFATAAIHVGQDPEKWSSRAIVPPNVNSSAFDQIAPGVNNGYLYGRAGNPMRNTLEECIAALDGGKHGFAFASGIGAIDTVISLLSSGDHVVCTEHVYSGTMRLLRTILSRMGISTTFTDFTDEHKVNNAIRQNTKMIWIETPTNPMMKVIDIAAVVKVTKKHCKDILVTVDNSFLTSYFQRPLDFGADIVVYSLTKYMNGHSDVIMGAAVLNDNSIAAKLRGLQSGMGSVPSPSDCYLVNRGLKTLPVRMRYHMKSSLIIAEWLQDHPKVVKVNHPGLPSHPHYEISKRQTSGFSGIFSFCHCGDLKESTKFLTSLKIFSLAVSVGGYESLAELPAKMSHDTVPADELIKLGITDSLIRLSIGLEDTEDLIADLEQAFEKAF